MTYLDIEQAGEIVIARLTIKRITADLANTAFQEALQAAQPARPLLLDFDAVDFLDSTGIGELVLLGKRLRACGSRFSIAGLPQHLMNLIRMMRLERIMDFDQNREDGLKRLRAKSTEANGT
jgi:anti-anti-sigma factor